MRSQTVCLWPKVRALVLAEGHVHVGRLTLRGGPRARLCFDHWIRSETYRCSLLPPPSLFNACPRSEDGRRAVPCDVKNLLERKCFFLAAGWPARSSHHSDKNDERAADKSNS